MDDLKEGKKELKKFIHETYVNRPFGKVVHLEQVNDTIKPFIKVKVKKLLDELKSINK